jgi:hypothetical protein
MGADVAYFPWMNGAGLQLGLGFDTLRWEPAGMGVHGREVPRAAAIDGAGQIVKYDLELIENEYHYRDQLHVSAGASFAISSFEGSASYDMYREIAIDSYNVQLVASVMVVNGEQSLEGAQLADDAMALWRVTSPGEKRSVFVRSFGDVYVNSVITGGQLLALFTFSAHSREEHEEIKASIGASYGGLISGSAAFSQAITEIARNHRTVLKIKRQGGNGPLPDASAAALIAAARSFPNDVHPTTGHPLPIAFGTQRYARVVGHGGIVIDVEAVDAERLIEDLSGDRDELQQRTSDFEFVRDAAVFFDSVDVRSVKAKLAELQSVLRDTSRKAEDVAIHRFENLGHYKRPKLDALPIPPDMPVGEVVPLRVDVTWLGGGTNVGSGEWAQVASGGLPRAALLTFRLSGVVLPPGNTLQYRAHQSGIGDTQWIDQGTATNRAQLEGVAIRIVGPQAHLYDVAYEVLTEDGEPIGGNNGGLAGSRGNYLPIVAARVVIRTTSGLRRGMVRTVDEPVADVHAA